MCGLWTSSDSGFPRRKVYWPPTPQRLQYPWSPKLWTQLSLV